MSSSDVTTDTDQTKAAPIRLAAPLARILSAYAHGGAEVPALTFAPVANVTGLASRSGHPPRGTLVALDSGDAVLSLDGYLKDRDDEAGTNVVIELADGSTVGCAHAYVTSQKTSIAKGQPPVLSTELQLTEWHWTTGEQPVAWVAVLRGADFKSSNLHVKGHGRWSSNSLRLEGNAAWHLTRKGVAGKRTCLVILDAHGLDMVRAQLWDDFAALEFLFGTTLRLDSLVGVNEKNEAVGAFGVSFGYRFRSDGDREPPLPEDRDKTWIAVAFPRLARALAAAEPNPVTIATCGYIDSTVGHIDGQYLFAQVALEALANRLTPIGKPVVNDERAWKAWVKSIRNVLKEHAADEWALSVLAGKVGAACRPTTSRLVHQTLQRMGIEAPREALDEIEGRNGVAHTLSMTDGAPYDIERDVRRVRIIRALLAALVLRHVGYEGALSGWDLDDQGWRKPVGWFLPSKIAGAEADQIYDAIAAGEPDAVGGEGK